MIFYIRQKAGEHPVMVALQHNPVFTGRNTGPQIFNHPLAVRSAVHQITDMHNRGVIRAMRRPVGRNFAVLFDQQIKMAMNIANSVAAHGQGPRSCDKGRGFHTPGPLWDICAKMKTQGSGYIKFQCFDLLEHAGRLQCIHHFRINRLIQIQNCNRLLPDAGSP